MSATRCQVVLTDRSTSGSLTCGVLRPEPRWSNCTIRYTVGSKCLRVRGLLPLPGPPCNTTTGLPSGLPLTSQYTWLPSPTSNMPCACGAIAGYSSSGLACEPVSDTSDTFRSIRDDPAPSTAPGRS